MKRLKNRHAKKFVTHDLHPQRRELGMGEYSARIHMVRARRVGNGEVSTDVIFHDDESESPQVT